MDHGWFGIVAVASKRINHRGKIEAQKDTAEIFGKELFYGS